MTIGFIPPTLEVLEGGVQAQEIPPFIQECMLIIITAVVITAMVKITERVIERR